MITEQGYINADSNEMNDANEHASIDALCVQYILNTFCRMNEIVRFFNYIDVMHVVLIIESTVTMP